MIWRFAVRFGILALAMSILACLIALIGPQDYEFGAQWGGPWEFMAAPTDAVFRSLALHHLVNDLPRPTSIGIFIALIAIVNSAIGAISGAVLGILLSPFYRKAEPAHAGDGGPPA